METARINAPQKNSVPTSAVTESAGSSQSPASSMQSSPLYAGPPALRLSSSSGGSAQGETLQPQIRSSLESSFQVDMSAVRVHTDARSSAAADSLSARAFTYGPNIFLGSGERPSDLALMAHEGAHVVQQQRVPALQMSTGAASTDTFEQEARQTSLAVQRGEQVTVRERTSNPRIQREEKEGGGSLISRFLDKVVEWVKRIPGYDLVTVILGKDPISGKPVERNAVNVIRGLVSLIPGGHDMFENLQKAGTIQRAFDWFNTEIGRLNLTWESIKALISQFWDAFSIWHPIRSIERIGEIFGPVLARLVNFAVAAGKKILEFIFEGVLSLAGSLGKQILGIIRKAGDVFSLIVKDPIGFLKNLVQAVKGGFQNFSKNILKHLKNALFEWLFGALQGVGLILPDKFDFKGIISIILQVLGLTYARLREKLVKLIGEPAVAFIEKAFEFLKLIVTQGIAAAWQKVLEFATGLIDTVIGGIRDWAAKTIVGAAITKLVTLFNPVGAIIQGIITIYNTVQFFIERAKQIAAVAEAIFDSISNIATGNIGGAIDYVEKTMARFLPVVIGFLARFIGLGGISGEIKKILQKIQTVVDNAINKVVNFVVEKGKALFGKKKDETKETTATVLVKSETVEKTFSMSGVSHKLILIPISNMNIEIESKRDLLSNKIGRAVAFLMKQVPKPETQINELISIGRVAKDLQKKAQGTKTDPTKKLNQISGFESDFNNLGALIQDYGQRYHTTDIEQLLRTSTTPTKEEEFRAIVDKATHITPAAYGKHWKGNSEEERRKGSKNEANNAPGQFLYKMTAEEVKALERETLLTGEREDRGGGTYHAYKKFSRKIGYANGLDAYWLRAELTTGNYIHSHPRLSKA